MEVKSTDETIYCLTHGCNESLVQISNRHEARCRLCPMIIKTEPIVLLTRISCPFISIRETACDILLIPSKGSFFDIITNYSGLHIGIVGVNRTILEFDRQGIKYGPASDSKWERGLPLNIIETLANTVEENNRLECIWAKTVQQFVENNQFQDKYDADNNNCLDFVISFLKLFHRLSTSSSIHMETDLKEFSDKIADKLVFCQNFVVNRTKHAARYMILSRKLESGTFCVSKESLM